MINTNLFPIINSLRNHKFLGETKFKAFADENQSVGTCNMTISDSGVENNVDKEENVDYQHFLIFPQFSKAFFLSVLKTRDCVVKA